MRKLSQLEIIHGPFFYEIHRATAKELFDDLERIVDFSSDEYARNIANTLIYNLRKEMDL